MWYVKPSYLYTYVMSDYDMLSLIHKGIVYFGRYIGLLGRLNV